MKKLSVITVTYNCVNLIQKTLGSVASQDQSIIEHIVIDGGSDDGTVEVINKSKDKLAYFISEPDEGIYDAMNKGIKMASGDWILFLNAGDIFYEKSSLSNIKFNWPVDAEFVVFTFLIEGEKELNVPNLDMMFGMPTSHQAMFISTKIAKQVKINSEYKVAADYDFFIKRYKLNKKCVYIEKNILSKVMPGGYSEINLNTMKNEYQEIIFKNLGLMKALIYFFWSRPFIFKSIKSILPISLFYYLKKKFRSLQSH